MFKIYPKPGSYNQFCARNPEILDLTERLHHLGQELSMWRATGDGVDLRTARLSIGEASVRADRDTAIDRGEALVRLTEWPKVGEYEVPEILRIA